MKVYIQKTNQNKNMKSNITVKELLKQLNINTTTVIVSVNNELTTLDRNLKDKDNVKILSVISGG